MSNPEDRVIAVAPGTKLPVNGDDPEHTSRVEAAAIAQMFEHYTIVTKYWTKPDSYPIKCLQEVIGKIQDDDPVKALVVCQNVRTPQQATARIWVKEQRYIQGVVADLEKAFGETTWYELQKTPVDGGYAIFISYFFDFSKAEGEYEYKYRRICKLIETSLFEDMTMVDYSTGEHNMHELTVRRTDRTPDGINGGVNLLNELAVLTGILESHNLSVRQLGIDIDRLGTAMISMKIEETGKDLPAWIERIDNVG